jgi:hypothetical protein
MKKSSIIKINRISIESSRPGYDCRVHTEDFPLHVVSMFEARLRIIRRFIQ